jgi:hypothetical protein
MNRKTMDELVRHVDPAARMGEEWGASVEARRTLARIVATPLEEPVSARPRRQAVSGSRGRLAAITAAFLVAGAGAAAAGAVLFGKPAPSNVRRDIAGVDAGLPADIRLNPDVASARSVASTGPSTLYYAVLKGGGYCTEITTTPNVGRGATCVTGSQVSSRAIDVAVPFTDPILPDSPVTVGGRVNAGAVSSLAIRYANGDEDAVPFGDERFFLFDVPSSHLAMVHAAAFELIARDAAGTVVAKASVPAVAPEDPNADHRQPIFVSTISGGGDLTKVLGVEGSVNVPGATSLRFRYPDGTTIAVPLDADGAYRFDIPSERQGDLYQAPGTLIAYDGQGRQLATAPVAAVAYWEGLQR